MTVQNFNIKKGFTLIELLVVIAVLGILAVGLIAVIDPADKIKSGNDTSAINAITQIGKANDAYATANSGLYPIAYNANLYTAFDNVVTALYTAGEIKITSVTESTGYTYNYLTPATCVSGAPLACTSYVFYTNLTSKKYTATPYFWYANQKGCLKAAVPGASTDTCP